MDERNELREALLRTFFEARPTGFPSSEADLKDLEDHLSARFDECEQTVMPWVASKVDLSGAEILEIGCGTGSSTASFAGHAGYVHGYDIIDRSVRAANERLRIMGISNAHCRTTKPETLLDQIALEHADGVDVVLLYAVMEHQSIEERLATLETCWRLLRPGGHLVVTDSPNRLCYRHYHTSDIPFFDMLPLSLAWTQLERSPRSAFRSGIEDALSESESKARDVLTRWGTGVSYHEFEAVLGPLGDLVVGDGFDPELAEAKPFVLVEELLLSYLVMTDQPVPLGFARVSIDVILRKPGGTLRERFRSNAEAHIDRIRSRLSDTAAPARAWVEADRAANANLAQLVGELSHGKDRIGDLQARLEAHVAKQAALHERALAAEGKLVALHARARKAEEGVESLHDRARQAESKIDSFRSRALTAEDLSNQLRQRAIAAEEKADGLLARARSAEKQIAPLRDRALRAESKSDAIRRGVARAGSAGEPQGEIPTVSPRESQTD